MQKNALHLKKIEQTISKEFEEQDIPAIDIYAFVTLIVVYLFHLCSYAPQHDRNSFQE